MKKVILEEQEGVNLADLNQGALVGFVTGEGHKGHVVAYHYNYNPVLASNPTRDKTKPNAWCGGDANDTIQKALSFTVWGGLKKAYVFETQKELYTWLAE